MSNTSKHQILVVDDEPNVRESLAGFLNNAGYDVSTAENGFDALLQLRRVTPDVIISDLNMPQMSGFEFLSVVRRRFPEISVVAVSGAYESGDRVPGGVIADAFYAKGQHHPEELLRTVAELIRNLGGTGDEPSSAVGSGLDTTERKGFQGSALHRADLHGMPAVFSIERAA